VTAPQFDAEPLLTPGEVAALFRVDIHTVSRWVRQGRFPDGTVIRTPGGRARFREAPVLAMRDGRT